MTDETTDCGSVARADGFWWARYGKRWTVLEVWNRYDGVMMYEPGSRCVADCPDEWGAHLGNEPGATECRSVDEKLAEEREKWLVKANRLHDRSLDGQWMAGVSAGIEMARLMLLTHTEQESVSDDSDLIDEDPWPPEGCSPYAPVCVAHHHNREEGHDGEVLVQTAPLRFFQWHTIREAWAHWHGWATEDKSVPSVSIRARVDLGALEVEEQEMCTAAMDSQSKESE
jgi:hypothetical protein